MTRGSHLSRLDTWRFLCLLILVGCVSSNHLDHLLVYSLPGGNSQQIQNPIITTTLGTPGAPVEVNTLPAVILSESQDQHIDFHHIHDHPTAATSTENPASPDDTYISYVTPAVTEPVVTGTNGVLGSPVSTQEPVTRAVTDSLNDFVTKTVTQLAPVLTNTVTQTLTFIPDSSTLTITDHKTITAPATVLTQTVVERVPQSTVTVTYDQEANITPLFYTITQSSFITVTQTRPFTVTQTLPLPTLPTHVPTQTLQNINLIPIQNLPRPTFVPINNLKDKYAYVAKLPLIFGKSIDQTSIPSEEGEGEFLIIEPAGSTVPLTEVPSTVDISNDNVGKSLDNYSDEKLPELIFSLDEVTPAIDIPDENLAKSLDSNDGVGKSLDSNTDEELSDFIFPLDEVTSTINIVGENVAKSLDNGAGSLVEITTNKPTVTTTTPTTVLHEVSSITTASTKPPQNIAKAISFVEAGDERVHDESLIKDAIEIRRGNLIYAIFKNTTDEFRRN